MLEKKPLARLARTFLIGFAVLVLSFLSYLKPVLPKAADDFLVKLGESFLEKGLIVDAEIECKKALIVNSANAQAKDCLARIHQIRGRRAPKDLQIVCLGQEVTYEATSLKNHPYSRYVWDFGDGVKKEAGAKTTHYYLRPGTYTISVLAEDFQKGFSYISDSGIIRVKVNRPPVADAGPNLVCCKGKEAVFDASGSYDPDGDSLSYYWDFGDGYGAEGIRVKHRYLSNGKYPVVLTVYDQSKDACNLATSGFVANVQAAPVAAMEIRSQ